MSVHKGLTVSIYKSEPNCSAGGVSSYCDRLTIVGTVDRRTNPGNKTVVALDKDSQVFEPRPDAPAAVLVRRAPMGGREIVHVEPLDLPEGHCMNGGDYVATSDSRFSKLIGFYGAVALHDRVEAWR
jgi:hypothetical protein